MRCRIDSLLPLLVMLVGGGAALAATTQPADPGAAGPAATQGAASTQPVSIVVNSTTEEGKKILTATLKRDGKAVEGAKVAFFIQRTFGQMAVGEDTTLDDGTAAVPFPVGLPGGAKGELTVIARVTAPAKYAGASATATLGGGAVVVARQDAFPRAIWAPRAPVPLLLVFLVLLGGVWLTYGYVLSQLIRIGKGKTK